MADQYSSFEKFHWHMLGWNDGAHGHTHSQPTKAHWRREFYDAGHMEGRIASLKAREEAAKKYDYNPSRLGVEGTKNAMGIQTRLPIFTNEDGEHWTPAAPGRRGGRGRE